jgi:hypothetical protein
LYQAYIFVNIFVITIGKETGDMSVGDNATKHNGVVSAAGVSSVPVVIESEEC